MTTDLCCQSLFDVTGNQGKDDAGVFWPAKFFHPRQTLAKSTKLCRLYRQYRIFQLSCLAGCTDENGGKGGLISGLALFALALPSHARGA
jgi:hypothetical protein